MKLYDKLIAEARADRRAFARKHRVTESRVFLSSYSGQLQVRAAR